MKTVTMRFEFPDTYEHDEMVMFINGCLTDMGEELADEITYTIIERK